jgi:hydrogenase expression/formation protein HypC
MCLAIPMTIKKIDGSYALAEANGVETSVNCAMMPDIKLGDKVLVHAGFIIEKLNPEDAKDIEAAWEDYYRILENEEKNLSSASK